MTQVCLRCCEIETFCSCEDGAVLSSDEFIEELESKGKWVWIEDSAVIEPYDEDAFCPDPDLYTRVWMPENEW